MPAVPPVDTRFKPGQSGNPSGRPKVLFSPEVVRTLVTKLMLMSKEKFHEHISNPETTMVELAAASVIAKAVASGDHNGFEMLLCRSIGKVREEIVQEIKKYDPELEKVPIEKIVQMVREKESA